MFQKMLLLIFIFLSSSLFADKISQESCQAKGEKYLFAGGECIEFAVSKGEREGSLNILVHGTWDSGTNVLGRYAPFAENLAMFTDITTVAIALPGYSNSSTNRFTSLADTKNLAATKEYVAFVADVIKGLKSKFGAETVNYIGHSAGAMIGATITGTNPNLIQHIALAGGRYDIHQEVDNDALISIIDVIDSVKKDTKFLLIFGSNDKISKPDVTISFFNIAKAKGLDAKIIEVKNAPHLDLDMSDTSISGIEELLDY